MNPQIAHVIATLCGTVTTCVVFGAAMYFRFYRRRK